MKVLITGYSGYIGQCLDKFFYKFNDIIGVDKKTPDFKPSHKFYKINLLNKKALNKIFSKEKIDIVIHLAGKSLVNEKAKYSDYYKNNVTVTNNILSLMKKYDVNKIIFSSTASIYKTTNKIINEKSHIYPKSKYAKTKIICENLIKQKSKNYIILRFFNVASSLPNLKRGENHKPETHLIPLFIKSALQKKTLKIYGKSYSTKDGTCVRDFVHIKDICEAIRKSFNILNLQKCKIIMNVGTNKGFSVLEVTNIISKLVRNKIKIKFLKSRKGDNPFLVCNYKKINRILKWKPKNSSLIKIIKDEILWQKSQSNSNFSL